MDRASERPDHHRRGHRPTLHPPGGFVSRFGRPDHELSLARLDAIGPRCSVCRLGSRTTGLSRSDRKKISVLQLWRCDADPLEFWIAEFGLKNSWLSKTLLPASSS